MSDTSPQLPATCPIDDALDALQTIYDDPQLPLFTKINQLDIIASRCHDLMVLTIHDHHDQLEP